MPEEWLTTFEPAGLSGYHPETLRELLREQKIKGRKFGIVWQVDRDSLISYSAAMKEKGQRRGPKPGSDNSQTVLPYFFHATDGNIFYEATI
jgi:hypothetical protein